MSEFTDGILTLKRDEQALIAALPTFPVPYVQEALNQTWVAIYPKEHNQQNPMTKWMFDTSKLMPILSFYNAEDHGWGYTLFHNGKMRAILDVNYELAFDLWLDLATSLYPDIDPFAEMSDEETQRLYQQVYQSDEYQMQVQAQFRGANVEAFSAFGFVNLVEKLQEILQVSWYLDFEKRHEQVAAFKQVLGIPKMSWKSYRYLTK
jgi:hypothetical protein